MRSKCDDRTVSPTNAAWHSKNKAKQTYDELKVQVEGILVYVWVCVGGVPYGFVLENGTYSVLIRKLALSNQIQFVVLLLLVLEIKKNILCQNLHKHNALAAYIK